MNILSIASGGTRPAAPSSESARGKNCHRYASYRYPDRQLSGLTDAPVVLKKLTLCVVRQRGTHRVRRVVEERRFCRSRRLRTSTPKIQGHAPIDAFETSKPISRPRNIQYEYDDTCLLQYFYLSIAVLRVPEKQLKRERDATQCADQR